MEKQLSDSLVHYFDVEQHRVACATRSAEDHSTKHARGVTCHDCIALLRERGEAGPSGSALASSR